MESAGFSHGAAFHLAFLPKLPSYKQTPWTATPAHCSSLTRRAVVLCCVVLCCVSPLAANFLNAHLEGITGAFMVGWSFWAVGTFTSCSARIKKTLRLRVTQCFCRAAASRLLSTSVGHLFRPTRSLSPSSVCANTVCPPPSSPDMKRFFQRLAPLYKPCGFEGKHSTRYTQNPN